MLCGKKYSKQGYVNRDRTDEAMLSAQAMAHIDCYCKTMKINDPTACDEELLDIMKEACEQKLRQHQSRRGKATAEEPMDDVEFEPISSDAPTVNITAATTPISPPEKKRRLEPNTPPVGFNVRSDAKDNNLHTPQSEQTSSRTTFSAPDDGPYHQSTPEGERVSVYIERAFDEDFATMETKIQQTIQIDDVEAKEEVSQIFGDWFHDIFDWNA